MGVGWTGITGIAGDLRWDKGGCLLGVRAWGRDGMVGPAPPPMMLSMEKLTLGLGDMAPPPSTAGAGDIALRCGECGAR